MRRVVVMGVAGSGKSTVGAMLAEARGVPFVDGDDLHPETNILKMAAGKPLGDDDRWPWLAAVGSALARHTDGVVVACSSLKRSYRDTIRASTPDVVFIHLVAPRDVLVPRIEARHMASAHFMGSGMVTSQLADLEPLGSDEHGIEVEVAHRSAIDVCSTAEVWLSANA
jgi:carbohydrate kinase (thermoresistant glucokinase family)